MRIVYSAGDGHRWVLEASQTPNETAYELIKCPCQGRPSAASPYIGAAGLEVWKGEIHAWIASSSAEPVRGHSLEDEGPETRGIVLVLMRDAYRRVTRRDPEN